MSTSDQLKLLSGSDSDKRQLFDQLIEKVVSEVGLSDAEIAMLECLKKMITQPQPIVVEMSSNLKGTSGIL